MRLMVCGLGICCVLFRLVRRWWSNRMFWLMIGMMLKYLGIEFFRYGYFELVMFGFLRLNI